MQNIYTTVKPFYIYARLLGLFPLSQEDSTEKGIFQVKWHSVAPTFIAMTVVLSQLFLLVFSQEPSEGPTKFHSTAWNIQTAVNVLIATIQLFYQTSKYRSILKFVFSLNSFDQKVSKISFRLIK